MNWRRAVVTYVGVVPVALIAVLSVRLCDWKLLGFYVLPSLILVAYIWGTFPWVFGLWRPAQTTSSEPTTPTGYGRDDG